MHNRNHEHDNECQATTPTPDDAYIHITKTVTRGRNERSPRESCAYFLHSPHPHAKTRLTDRGHDETVT